MQVTRLVTVERVAMLGGEGAPRQRADRTINYHRAIREGSSLERIGHVFGLGTPVGGYGMADTAPAASRVAGVFGLGEAVTAAEAEPADVLVRATNSANVLTLGLKCLPENQRKAALRRLFGESWTRSVLALAKRMGEGLGIETSVRFSFALHFVIGILDDTGRRDTQWARAYRTVKTQFEGQRRRADSNGVGTLAGDDCGWNPICHAANAVNRVTAAASAAGQAASTAISQAFNWTGDVLCKGLKWLLGDTVGGIVCAIFNGFLTLIKYTLTSLIDVARAVGRALIGVIQKLIAGDVKGAALLFLSEVTAAVFVAPPIGPVFAVLLGVSTAEIADMGRKVAKKHPTFIVGVASAVLGITAVTPEAVVNVVQALRPAIAVFVGAAVVRAARLPASKTEAAEAGVDSVVQLLCSITVGVANGVRVAKDIAKKADAAQAQISNAEGVEATARAVEKGITEITKAFEKFRFHDMSAAIQKFVVDFGLAGKTVREAAPPPPVQRATSIGLELKPAEKADAIVDIYKSIGTRDQDVFARRLRERGF